MATRKKTAATKKKSTAHAKTARRTALRRSTAKSSPARKASAGFQLASIAPSLTVNDLAASVAWYCDVLGFTVGQRWEHEGEFVGAELKAGGTVLYIGRDDWKMGRDRVKGQGLRLYWYTDQDIDRLAAGIKARGGTLITEPKDEWGTRSFNLEDPTGFKITISSRK